MKIHISVWQACEQCRIRKSTKIETNIWTMQFHHRGSFYPFDSSHAWMPIDIVLNQTHKDAFALLQVSKQDLIKESLLIDCMDSGSRRKRVAKEHERVKIAIVQWGNNKFCFLRIRHFDLTFCSFLTTVTSSSNFFCHQSSTSDSVCSVCVSSSVEG